MSRWVQCNHGVLTEGGSKVRVREGDVMTEAEVRGMSLPERGHKSTVTLEAGKSRYEFFSRAPRRKADLAAL